MKYKKAQVRRISVFTILISIILIGFVFAFNVITEDPSNPANGTITSNSSIVFNYNISTNGEGISDIKISVDNVNTSLMSGLLGACNFDNRSSLGENSTLINCWSPNGGFNGTILGNSLTFVVLTSSVYFLIPNNIRIDVTGTSTTFKVYENNSWITSGVETINLYNGTKLLTAKSRNVSYETSGTTVTAFRNVDYGNGISLKYTIAADGSNKDIELYPMFEKIEVTNGKGFILHYDVSKLLYEGATVSDVTSPQSFGHKMKVEWELGNYYSKITKTTSKPEGKLTVKYKINSDSFSKNVRLFDPTAGITFIAVDPVENPYITTNTSINITTGINDNSEGITQIKSNWNGTNITDFDSSVQLFFNFDNRSELGENQTHIFDLSQYNNNGTAWGNPVIGNIGKYNGAYQSDGSGDKINLTSSNLNETFSGNNLTIAFWINYTQTGDYINLFSTNSVTLQGYANTGMYYRFKNATGSTTYYGAGNFVVGSWVFTTLTYDGTSIKVYKNGALVSTETLGGNLNGTTDNLITFGQAKAGLDDFIILNKALSLTEIQRMYSKTQITKFNSTYWEISVKNNSISNAVLNSSNNYQENYSYYTCASNLSLDEACQSPNTVIRSISTSHVIANFTTLKGTIPTDFYGTNTHSYLFAGTNEEELQNAYLNGNLVGDRFDVSLAGYSNSSDGSINFTGDFSDQIREVKFCYDNNLTCLALIDSMPEYLQNRTSGYCTSTNWASCPPNNLTKHDLIIADAINRITSNGLYISAIKITYGNEMYGSSWLNNLSRDHITKGIEYVKMYNSSYIYLKTLYPTLQIGTTSVVSGTTVDAGTTNMTNTLISNLSGKMDMFFVSRYSGNTDMGYYVSIDYNYLQSRCAFYGSTCPTFMYYNEWNAGDSNLQNNSIRFKEYEKQTARGYEKALNYYTGNISMFLYHFTNYAPYNPSLNEYPFDWAMYQRDSFLNAGESSYKATYNLTRDMAKFCVPTGNIYQSSDDDSNLLELTCTKGNMKAIILINPSTTGKNISIDLTDSGITNLKNYYTGEIFAASANTNIGTMDAYDIIFLYEDLQPPTLTIDSPTATSYDSTLIYFNITLDEEGDTCVYSLDNFITNYSMTKQGWVNEFKASNDSMSQANHTVKFWCNDTSGNVNNTANVTFLVDSVYPLIDYGTGTEVNYANLSQNFIYVNTTWTETNLANITFSLYNDLGEVNVTTFTTDVYLINWTNLPNLNYTYFVNITDLANNKNSTAIRHILLDTGNPTTEQGYTDGEGGAGFIVGTNNSFTNNLTINFTANASDTWGIDTINITIKNQTDIINSTTWTLGGVFNYIIGLPLVLVDGIYDWIIEVYDMASNFVTTTWMRITLDSTLPTISINYPANQTYYVNSMNFNITINDLYPDTCWFNLNNGNNITMNNLTSDNYNYTNSSMIQGTYNIKFYCNDSANNINYTNVSFTIDWGGSSDDINWDIDDFEVKNITGSDYVLFNNTNVSDSKNVNIYGLTDALIHNGTNIINISSNIPSNDGNINITLRANETAYVINAFNLTEGVIRTSPIWISSTTGIEKNIASNLSDTINITGVFTSSLTCSNILSIRYTPKDGSTITITNYTCLNKVVTIYNLNINPSSSSNILQFLQEYSEDTRDICNNMFVGYALFFSNAPLFLSLFAIIVIIGIIGLIYYAVKNPEITENLDFKSVIIFSLALGIIAISAVVGIIILNVLCGV